MNEKGEYGKMQNKMNLKIRNSMNLKINP